MIPSKYLLTVLLFLSAYTALAHQDFYRIMDYGNVKVRIKTGYEYEEINKVFIFGQLAQKLCAEMDYTGQIFLDFTHDYTCRYSPSYFISFDKAIKKFTYEDGSQEQFLKDNSIVIRLINRSFNATSTLQLLEYAIKNKKAIKSKQKQIDYTPMQWRIYSTDTIEINQQLKLQLSNEIKKILTNRIYRPEENFTRGTSYYWLNNNYYLFQREINIADTELISIQNIYLFTKFNYSDSIVFDSCSTFYYINGYASKVSANQTIENINDQYKPFKTNQIDSDKVSINFWDYTKQERNKNRTLLYLIKNNILIQDLDKLLESSFKTN